MNKIKSELGGDERVLKIGLTGNIACGKSSVSKELEKRGIHIIDADLISREIYKNEDVMMEMRKFFYDAIDNGEINRKKLGELVFYNEDKLKKLNQITHKKIKSIIEERLSKYQEKNEIAVVDAALLYEAGFEDMVDKVIVVYCDEKEQLKRVMLRDNLSKDEATKRINSQMSQEKKIKRADYIIDNSYTREDLKDNVIKLMLKIRAWMLEGGGI
ncbi:dephospho-CoA kinase [Peptostreptococcus russellii]|uniref:dephospho-CoA kinase n=1 Tax=Peptostreptococcus russellii TaxID=215200 RepID=UPI001FA85D2E|nr:dephospho-CoA kinase [Peptostreptococcus russellii]